MAVEAGKGGDPSAARATEKVATVKRLPDIKTPVGRKEVGRQKAARTEAKAAGVKNAADLL